MYVAVVHFSDLITYVATESVNCQREVIMFNIEHLQKILFYLYLQFSLLQYEFFSGLLGLMGRRPALPLIHCSPCKLDYEDL